jgi:hypothetical protein
MGKRLPKNGDESLPLNDRIEENLRQRQQQVETLATPAIKPPDILRFVG